MMQYLVFALLLSLGSVCCSNSIRFAFGSCNRVQLHNPLWPFITNRKPNVYIWGGDNIYADTLTPGPPAKTKSMLGFIHFKPLESDEYGAIYDQQLNIPEYKKLVDDESVTIIGTWDDHDYGLNDADRTFFDKEVSQEAFLDFFGVPKDDPRRKREGIYHKHKFSLCDLNKKSREIENESEESCDSTVSVFLIDVRTHKDPWNYSKQGKPYSMLGEEQWKWLEEGLCASTSKVNLLVSGLQVLPERYFAENWNLFPKERQRLMDLLAKCKVKAPILLSGDVHMAEFMEAECSSPDATLYLPEVTSSGMTHSWGTRVQSFIGEYGIYNSFLKYGMTLAHAILPFKYKSKRSGISDSTSGTIKSSNHFLGLNFAQIDIEEQNNDISITISAINDKDEPVITQTWKASELDYSKFQSESIVCQPVGGAIGQFATLVSHYVWLVLCLTPVGMMIGLIVGVVRKCCCQRTKVKKS